MQTEWQALLMLAAGRSQNQPKQLCVAVVRPPPVGVCQMSGWQPLSTCHVHLPAPASRSMCLFIQNQNFERYTENMLNQLAEGSKFAKSQLDAMSGDVGRLAGTAAELAGKAEATLGLLREHRELEEVRKGRGWLVEWLHQSAFIPVGFGI